MNEAAPEPGPTPLFEHAQQVGTVELDRYCAGCGYNLRQQAIRRETATNLLLCKCPECGGFEPANTLTTAHRSWFQLFIVVVWFVWLLIWLGLILGSVSSLTGLAMTTGEIRRDWVDLDELPPGQVIANSEVQNSSSYYTNNVMALHPMTTENQFALGIFLALAAVIGAVMTGLTTVAMPHWPRWGYVGLAIGWPLIVILLFHGLLWREMYNWRLTTVDYMRWHLNMAVTVEAVAIAGGLLAVWLGRPVARRIVSVLVSPNRRGPFAFLWLADGKTPPKTVRPAR